MRELLPSHERMRWRLWYIYIYIYRVSLKYALKSELKIAWSDQRGLDCVCGWEIALEGWLDKRRCSGFSGDAVDVFASVAVWVVGAAVGGRLNNRCCSGIPPFIVDG